MIDLDAHISNRLRLRRQQLNVTQESLAQACGLTAQQIQKCEAGEIRLSAARLWIISQAMSTPVSFFFDKLAEDGSGRD
ncbi:MAG: helix-turn-helix domain-containing protein [Phenylobacterium sp.]